jgi:hypothetical protein
LVLFARKKRALLTSTLDLELRKKLMKCYIWSIALYGAETWTLRAADQKRLGSFEMWCWRRMEKIIWTGKTGGMHSRLGRPHRWSELFGEHKNVKNLPGFELQTVQSVAYSLNH